MNDPATKELNYTRSGSILVANENATDLAFLTNLLTDEGYRVHPASDGIQALRFVESTPPDLILLQSELADQNGLAVCRRLKSDPRTASIPLILTFLQTDKEERAKSFREGAVDYICKPFLSEEILTRVKLHLRRRDQTKQSTPLLSFAFDHIAEAVFLIDEKARFHYVNEESCRVLGYSRSELMELGVPDVDPDFTMERWPAHWEELKSKNSMIFEGHHKRKDGRIIPVEINANYLEYEGKSYNLALVRDITERRMVEAALAESEERYRMVFENSPVSVWEEDFSGVRSLFDKWRAEGISDLEAHFHQHPEALQECADLVRITGVNRAALSLHGAHDKQELFAGLARTFTSESYETFREELIHLWRGATSMRRDGVVKTLAGELRDVTVYFSVCPGHEETLAKIIVSLVDITDRKQAEEVRQGNLHFFQGMDRVNRAIQRANDLKTMMSDVLDEVLEIFSCDRASLIYPCDPDAPSWKVPMERFRPEFPGVFALDVEMPMTTEVAAVLRASLLSDQPVAFGAGTEFPIAPELQKYGNKSGLGTALYPKLGKSWGFAIVQSSHERQWTEVEQRLFAEIGRKLSDGITSLISYEDLLQSEEKYRRIVDTSNEGIWVLDSSICSTFVNNRMTEILGYSEQEILGKPFTDFMFESEIPDHLVRMENRRQGISETYERRFRTKRGEEVWMLVSATPVFNRRGGFDGSFGMFSDITTRKKMEQELQEERKLFIGGPNVAFRWRAAEGWPVEYVSPNCMDQFGYAPDEFTSGKILYAGIVHPDDLARVGREVTEYSESGVPFFEQEYRIKCANGEYCWLYDFTTIIRDSRGEITHYQGYVVDITARKQAEEALLKTTTRLKEAQRLAHIGNWELDLKTNILTWSEEIFRIFEIDPEKFGATYEAFLNAIHPDDRETVNLAYTESLKTRIPYSIDHRLLFSDGRVKYVHEQCETFYDGDTPIRSIGTVQDITDRKLAEELLRRINRELRAISNCNQTLMRAEDEQTLLNDICRIICDDAGYRMSWVGYAEDDAAKTIRPVASAGFEDGYLERAAITWDETERGNGPSGIAIRSGKSSTIQDFGVDPMARPWREDALQRGYRSSAALPLKDERGVVFGILCIYSSEPEAFTPGEIRLLEELAGDLAFGITTLRTRTERNQAEEALKESEQQYRELLENLPVGVIIHNPDSSIRYWNTIALELLGIEEEQMSGRSAFDPEWHFVNDTGETITPYLYPVNIVIREKQILHDYVIGIVPKKSDSPVWVYVNAFPEFDSRGDLKQVVVTFVNFSERKQLEEDLKKLNDTLEQRVNEELAKNRQKDHVLIQQSRLAAMGEMVQNIAHQWRQPLNTLSLITYNVQDEFDYGEMTHDSLENFVKQMQAILQQMSSTIDDFRNFFQPDREPEDFEIASVVHNSLSLMEAAFRNNNIDVMESTESGLRAFGYSGQFAQAILNILSNAKEAIKTRNRDGGKIEIRLIKANEKAVLTIQDNGGGIPDAILPRIFDPYFTTKDHGSGIGLYMTRIIIERNLNGFIQAESDSTGTLITVSLPLIREDTVTGNK